jgi:hypothetical protein
MPFTPRIPRRAFLRQSSAACAIAPCLAPSLRAHARFQTTRLRVAAVCTEFTYRSHAHVILENFLEPYLFNGEVLDPPCQIASLYLDQTPQADIGRAVAAEYKIPVFHSISDALTLASGELAVDAVLSIGEHGDYPVNAKAQREYPRKRFFDEITRTFEKTGRSVPVFNDKHLSYRWDWAREMVDTARRMNFPLMAGSSVPLAQRKPDLNLPPDTRVRHAISIHGGGVESYDFHALEILQSIVEARAGGETGVSAVAFLEGDVLANALKGEDRWAQALLNAAMNAERERDLPRQPAADAAPGVAPRHAIRLTYSDGLIAYAFKLGESGIRWNIAVEREGGEPPLAFAYDAGPWQNRNLFRALSHAIQLCFVEKKSPYPVERTLLTTGVLDAAMDSRIAGGKPITTPQLAIAYSPGDWSRCRERGKSWEILHHETPEPPGICRFARALRSQRRIQPIPGP